MEVSHPPACHVTLNAMRTGGELASVYSADTMAEYKAMVDRCATRGGSCCRGALCPLTFPAPLSAQVPGRAPRLGALLALLAGLQLPCRFMLGPAGPLPHAFSVPAPPLSSPCPCLRACPNPNPNPNPDPDPSAQALFKPLVAPAVSHNQA